MRGTCKNCRCWQAAKGEGTLGECHYRAPSPPGNGQALDRVRWPLTMIYDWCVEGWHLKDVDNVPVVSHQPIEEKS